MEKLKALWKTLWSPSQKFSLGLILLVGMAGGFAIIGAFNFTMHATGTEAFCISCHEMESGAFAESTQFPHHMNRLGIHATCVDCHLPTEFVPRMIRKIEASREVYHHLLGTIDTPEKYEAYRPVMAERVWARMKATDSSACRSCHSMAHMKQEDQKRRAWNAHQDALETGETCIDCHKGIAHKPVVIAEADTEALEEEEDLDFTL